SYRLICCCSLFVFNATAPSEIYTLSLHDALPISSGREQGRCADRLASGPPSIEQYRSPAPRRLAGPLRPSQPITSHRHPESRSRDRKSTRLNSSHRTISYAVFCLKKKKKKKKNTH